MAAPAPPSLLTLIDASGPGPVWPNINVVVQDLGNLTSDEFVLLSRLQMKALGGSAKVERDEPIGRAGGGHRFEFVSFAGPKPQRFLQHVLFHGGRAYITTALAQAQDFETYRQRFEQALGSVALKVAA